MEKGCPEISQKLSEPLNISETQKRVIKMGVKEFWKNRSYFSKGAIIGIIFGLLAYFGYIIYGRITSSVPIPKPMLIYVFLSGLMISVMCGLIFGFFGFLIGFLIGLVKKKKWKLLIILLVILVISLLLLLLFLIPKYLYVQSCWSPPCYGPPHPIEIKPTKLWQNTYDLNESWNTLEFPYSKAILDCPVSLYIKFSESPQIVESVNLEGKELLLEPITITPLILEDYNLTKPEGVLEVKVRAKSKSNIFIQMSQYKEPC